MKPDNYLIAGPEVILDSVYSRVADGVCTEVYVYTYLPIARMWQALAAQVEREIRERIKNETK